MVKSRVILIVVVSILVGIISYFVLFQNEEAKVKKRFYYFAETIEKIPGENQIVAIANANRLKDVIIEKCKIEVPAHSMSREISKNDLSTFILARRFQFSEISLSFYDFLIEFPEENTSIVIVTVSMEGYLKNGDSIEDIHELKCGLQKIEGIWILTKIEVVEVLRR